MINYKTLWLNVVQDRYWLLVKDSKAAPMPNFLARIHEGLTLDGVLPETVAFLQAAMQTEAYKNTPPSTAQLIDVYYGTDATLKTLEANTGISSERIRQLIRLGLDEMWNNLPPDVQAQYPKEQVITLKKAFSPETRARISQANKGRPSPHKGKRRLDAKHITWKN